MTRRRRRPSDARAHARDVAAHLLLRTLSWVVLALAIFFCYKLIE